MWSGPWNPVATRASRAPFRGNEEEMSSSRQQAIGERLLPVVGGVHSVVADAVEQLGTSRLDCAVKVSANRSRELEIAHGRVPLACIGDSRPLRGHFPHADERAHRYWLFGLVTAMCRERSARQHICLPASNAAAATYGSCRSPMIEIDVSLSTGRH
jgi:hypothetical protein